MSIQKLTYELCKTVQKSPHITDIKNLIQSISFNNEHIIFRQTVRGLFKYPKIQFLGYMVVGEPNRETGENSIQKIIPLDENELDLLANCHAQLWKINKSCISPIIEKIPQLELAISPFNLITYNNPNIRQDTDSGFELFDNEKANEVVTAFHNHPAIKIFFETLEKLQDNIDEQHYLSDVTNFAQDIIEAKFENPKWLVNEREIPQNYHLQHMLALVCLRDSLSNLNQLIFQAAAEIEDKLLVFDENNLIDVSPTYSSNIGRYVRIFCQNDDLRFILSVEPPVLSSGVLVLLKDVNGHKGVQLGRTIAYQGTLGLGTGQFDIELIDENLNTFPRLLVKYNL